MIKKALLLSFFGMVFCAQHICAQNYRYETRFYFRLNKYDIDESLNGNDRAIDSILYKLRDLKQDGKASNVQLHITSYASLEASDKYNYDLAGKRTQSLRDYLRKFVLLNDVPIITDPNVFDWNTLMRMTRESECPFKDEALRIMQEPEFEGGVNVRKSRLEKLGGGITYQYMRQRFFPHMRNSALTLTATVPVVQQPVSPDTVFIHMPPAEKEPRKKIHAALSTNLLYDVVTLGNIGLDIYLGKQISIGANWMYTWWKNDNKKFYWRAYGGDAHIDYWFNKEKLWHGHHMGLYAQMLTFDVELNKKVGYQGPKWLYGGGLSYGYAMGIGKRLTLDFGLSIGYLGGKYYEYNPSSIRDKYLYNKTHQLNWVGPTSAKLSLVWNFDL